MENFPEVATYDVACRSAGCENEGVVIRVTATAENPQVICGGVRTVFGETCGVPITDITLVEE